MCIAHYIAKVVAEEEKKGRKPRPNKLYTPIHAQTNQHKMSRTLRCPVHVFTCIYIAHVCMFYVHVYKNGTMYIYLPPHPHLSLCHSLNTVISNSCSLVWYACDSGLVVCVTPHPFNQPMCCPNQCSALSPLTLVCTYIGNIAHYA